MRRLVVLLSITTVLFMATTVYFYSSEHAPAAAKDAEADTVVAPAPESEAPSAAEPAPPSPVAATAMATDEAPASRREPGEYDRAFLAREADPERRPQLLEETRVGLRQRYPGLEHLPRLEPATYEQLMSLLAEQLVQTHKTSIECKYASTCGTATKQLRDAQQAELAALLGPDGKQQFEQYLESRSERLQVNSMRGRLTDENRLPDAQAEALALALADERRRVADDISQRGLTQSMTFDGIPLVYLPGITYEDLMGQARAYQERLRTRAATLLNSSQLAVYDQIVAEKMIVVGAMIQSTVENQAKVSK
jgi:hypothetical protein